MRRRVASVAVRAEQLVEQVVRIVLGRRLGWQLAVVPYVGHGTPQRCRVRARVLLVPREPVPYTGRLATLRTTVGRYASVDVPDVSVRVEVAGVRVDVVSDVEGYLDAGLGLPGLDPGWHQVTYRLGGAPPVRGPLLVVDPGASLGVVSDLDDTVLETGLTRALTAVRSTLLLADADRVAIHGAAELYRGLVAGGGGRAPVFYVSAGAWNLHGMLVAFLARTGFPAGPLLLTDWGPAERWVVREGSADFKTRTVLGLVDEHPRLSWVLVGDSGQQDAEAYARVVRARPGRVLAVYIRDVPPASVLRSGGVTRLAAEVEAMGVPMLLVHDSAAAARHARSLGLLDDAALAAVVAAVAR